MRKTRTNGRRNCCYYRNCLCSMYTKPYKTCKDIIIHATRLIAVIFANTRSRYLCLIKQAAAIGEVDPAFIQDPKFRPKPEYIEAEEIPVINLSNFSTTDIKDLVSAIGNACRKWGFFQVINHGVPLELRQGIEKAAKEFFHLDLEEKRKVKRDEFNAIGYHDSEHTKNVRDWKEVFDFLLNDQTVIPASHEPDDHELRTLINQWPCYPTSFRKVRREYAKEVENLGFKLLGLISLSLGLPADRFHGYFKDQTSYARLNYYPPCPVPDLALGLGRHKDSGALTVLAQDDVGGLEVKQKSDGEWVRVKPIPDALIINVGDVVQVWSNGAYESVEHRVVVNSEKERISIPLFLGPSHTVYVKPLDELVNQQNAAKYKEYNWGKFYANRKGSNYKKQTIENIQIDHFKV